MFRPPFVFAKVKIFKSNIIVQIPEMFRFLQTKDFSDARFLCLVSLGRNIRQSLGQFILLFLEIISVALNNSITLPRTSLDSA